MKRYRLTRDERRELLLQAAIDVADDLHYLRMGLEDIADRAGVSKALVPYHLGGLDAIREAVMAEAVRRGHERIVAQGLLARDPLALGAGAAVRRRAKKLIDLAVNS